MQLASDNPQFMQPVIVYRFPTPGLKEVAMEPPIDLLISKLIPPYHFVWHSSNKAVSLSVEQHQPLNIADRFQVCHANGCGFTSQLGTLRFHNGSG